MSNPLELKALSRPKDCSGDLWHPLMTVGRIDRIMKFVIISYLIIGTVIWGYGNNLKKWLVEF
jgi:hypothetical protein